MFPTADQVARAVVAACRITGADPVAVVSRETDSADATFAIARARGYAALALRQLFPKMPSAALDRIVGAPQASWGAYSYGLVGRVRKNQCKSWFDRAKLAQVVAEVERHSDFLQPHPAEPAAPRPKVPAPQSSVRFGEKKRLEEELRQAILNTGGRPA